MVVRDVDIGGATLRVESQGDGPPVVLHPSLGRWSRDFDLLAGAIATHEVVRTIVLLGAGGLVHGDDEARAAVTRCFELDLPEAERLQAVQTAFFAPENDPRVWIDGWFPIAKNAQQHALVGVAPEHWWVGGVAPMLIVQGLQDRAAPPENGRRLHRERKAPTELVEVDGAGHALLPEQPDNVATPVVSFLRRIESAGEGT